MRQRNRTQRVLDEPRVSAALRKALRLAQQVKVLDLERWCRLELGGYVGANPAMGEDVTVPAYRTVVGQHADVFGQVLMLEPDLEFINETRLRQGVEELEFFAERHNVVTVHDPGMCQRIREHLGVEVYAYRFTAAHVVGILSHIRTELSERLGPLEPLPTPKEPRSEAVLMLRPNFHGIGIDLPALWRRWKGTA